MLHFISHQALGSWLLALNQALESHLVPSAHCLAPNRRLKGAA
jgi:hypothetical protein